MGNEKIERRTFEIERNLSLEGFVSNIPWLNCDVTTRVNVNGREDNYALLSQGTRFGITELGYIEPTTKEFKKFESSKDVKGADTTHFESTEPGGSGRKTKMYVPVVQLQYLKTLSEVLSMPGISFKS